MREYSASDLDQVVTARRPSRSADDSGGYSVTEADLSTFRACVEPLRGSESRQNAGLQAIQEAAFIIYTAVASTLQPTDVLVWQSVRYNIRQIQPAGRALFTRIIAESGVVQ